MDLELKKVLIVNINKPNMKEIGKMVVYWELEY